MNLKKAVQEFCTKQQYTILSEMREGRVFHVRDSSGKPFVLKIDPLDPKRRPGKPKGIAQGETGVEGRKMEHAFAVMKDYRFFTLCLPAVYGMGRYEEAFDWFLMKWYDGEPFAWSMEDGGKDMPEDSAAQIAMMVFDLTQVPVLKFSKKVDTKNYEEYLTALAQNTKTYTAVVEEARKFIQDAPPTLFTIQNGAFSPGNMLQLEESVVLFDWAGTQITVVEEVVVDMLLHMWNNAAWQKRFIQEVTYLLELQPEWFLHMMRIRAIEKLQESDAESAPWYSAITKYREQPLQI